MNIKQDIIIRNEYTLKSQATGKGSRGSTPGDYLRKYMARERATETLAPIRHSRTDDFIMRYMVRDEAVEIAESTEELKDHMRQGQGKGGVSFGYGQVSLSHEELKLASADIQDLYEDGHTVMLTVLSFDQEYLRRHGLIPEGFQCTDKGDYRGNLDQMKLRMAISHGLDRMAAKQYDELRYVGVIQVDTEHAHCHLVMVDAGRGSIAVDGRQRGKLDASAKSTIRRGIDAWLDEKSKVAHLSSAVAYERMNVVSYVKRWAHQKMLTESTPQFLLACLPEDRKLWRAGTNRKEMSKPNRILRDMIEDAIAEPESSMHLAMEEIHSYADHRRAEEGLNADEWQRLIADGRAQIIERCMNGVYGMLRALPDNELQIRTPMLDVMSLDYEDLAAQVHQRGDDADSDLVSFGFRLRSYASRLEYHRERRDHYHSQARNWQALHERGQASDDSAALHAFYLEEEDYHARLMSKYQYFLPFTPDPDSWYQGWNEVAEYGEKMLGLQMMSRDQTLVRMKNEDKAEEHGILVYGQRGGSLLTRGAEGKRLLAGRLERMEQTYQRKLEDLRVALSGQGLTLTLRVQQPGAAVLDERGAGAQRTDPEDTVPGIPLRRRGGSSRPEQAFEVGVDDEAVSEEAVSDDAEIRPSITPGTEYDFELVKALDLHHMSYDFGSDVELGPRARHRFVVMADERAEIFDAYLEYLEKTDQADSVDRAAARDVTAMVDFADDLVENDRAVLPSQLAELARNRQITQRSKTVSLDADVALRVDSHMELSARAAVDRVIGRQAGRQADTGLE